MEAAIKWAESVLREPGHPPPTVEPVVETPYSCVKKLTSGGNVFYFKQTPPLLFVEVEIIGFLRAGCGVTRIPEIIAQNKDLHCFLMKPCGTESLRTMFARKFDMLLFLQGADTYKAIQRATEKHVERLLETGIPDWRLTRLPKMYDDLVDDATFLQRCGMAAEQCQRLRELKGAFFALCAELAAFNIPDSLTHSDYQANNILADASGAVCVIDWGEVAVGNPLLSMSKYLKTVSNQNKFDSDTYRMTEERFYRDYFRSGDDMRRGARIVEMLSFIHYQLTMRKLEELTEQTIPKWNDKMTYAFTAFLDAMK